MYSELFKRVEAVFEKVADLEPEARSLALDEFCAGDKELREEVESLITASEDVPRTGSEARLSDPGREEDWQRLLQILVSEISTNSTLLRKQITRKFS